MKALKEKRNKFHALLGMGIVILCVFALALTACGDSNTGDPSGGNPWIPTPGPGPADPGGNQNGSNGGGVGGEEGDERYVLDIYVTRYLPLFETSPFTILGGNDAKLTTAITEASTIRDYFAAIAQTTASDTTYSGEVERQGAMSDYLGLFPISYEGMAPDLTGLKVTVKWSDGKTETLNGGDAKIKTFPPVLSQAEVSRTIILGGASGDDDESGTTLAAYLAGLKQQIYVYYEGLPGTAKPIYLPVVVGIDRGATPVTGAGWFTEPAADADIVKAGSAVAKIYEDDEIPTLTGASVSVKYPKEFQISTYDHDGDGGTTPELAISLKTAAFTTGYQTIPLNEGHIFVDYYRDFGTGATAPSAPVYLRNGIDGKKVYVMISRAAQGHTHGGGTANESVFFPVTITKVEYIRQVELATALEWDNGGVAYYLQNQAPDDADELFDELVAAGITLKVTYSDGTTKTRDTEFVERAAAAGNAEIVDYVSGNGYTFSKFEDDWSEDKIGYLTFAYYSSLIPGFSRRQAASGFEGDYSNFVFEYNTTGVRPRIPVALYQPGQASFVKNTGYPDVAFVGRDRARDRFDGTNATTIAATSMTNAEFDRIKATYKLKGVYLFNDEEIVEELIPSADWSKGWFNGGRDPFVNRDERPSTTVNVPFVVPAARNLTGSLAKYLLFAGEEVNNFDVEVYVYEFDPDRT